MPYKTILICDCCGKEIVDPLIITSGTKISIVKDGRLLRNSEEDDSGRHIIMLHPGCILEYFTISAGQEK